MPAPVGSLRAQVDGIQRSITLVMDRLKAMEARDQARTREIDLLRAALVAHALDSGRPVDGDVMNMVRATLAVYEENDDA
jgi:hypothetical protein